MRAGNRFAPTPTCVLCGGPVEAWHGGNGYGHNPAPLKTRGRCCNTCQASKVLPARYLGLAAAKITEGGSIECPNCHWGFAPWVIVQHIKEKH